MNPARGRPAAAERRIAMAEIAVPPRFLNSIDALVWLAAHPLPPPTRARVVAAPAQEPRTAPQEAPKAPTQPTPHAPPPAAAPALFSAEYAADVYAKRLRRVMAAQAELVAAVMSASRPGGRS
jgi:hypothetical protein